MTEYIYHRFHLFSDHILCRFVFGLVALLSVTNFSIYVV